MRRNPANPSLYDTAYGYTQGDLSSISYASGLKVSYRRLAGRITLIDVQEPGGGKAGKPVVPFLGALSYSVSTQRTHVDMCQLGG